MQLCVVSCIFHLLEVWGEVKRLKKGEIWKRREKENSRGASGRGDREEAIGEKGNE